MWGCNSLPPSPRSYAPRSACLQHVVFGTLHTEKADLLCHKLVTVCPRKPELIPFKHLEVNRNEIQLTKKLGAGKFGEVWKGEFSSGCYN